MDDAPPGLRTLNAPLSGHYARALTTQRRPPRGRREPCSGATTLPSEILFRRAKIDVPPRHPSLMSSFKERKGNAECRGSCQTIGQTIGRCRRVDSEACAHG
jgi:hypothetical protein